MSEIIFYISAQPLHWLANIFGITYQDASAIICIYAVPAICTLCAFASIFSCKLSSFWGRTRACLNVTLTWTYALATLAFWEYYFGAGEPYATITYKCADDFIWLSNVTGLSYFTCSNLVYCVLFPAIVLFHLSQFWAFRKPKPQIANS